MRPIARTRAAILLILLTGTVLRLFRLGSESLWYDETVSTYLAGSPLPELIRHTALDIHPPGYYVLLRGWLLLMDFGNGRADPNGFGLEWTAAFLSLFFGVLLIALVYALTRRLAGERTGLIAAALVALSPYNVWYGQEVRMYTVGAVLGVVAVWGLVRASSPVFAASWSKHSPWFTYAVSAALGLYTLYYFAFLLIPLNLWALWQAIRRGRVGRWLLANLGVVILYAPWIPNAWRQATQPPVPPWRTAPDALAAIAETWQALVLGQSARGWVWPVLLLAVLVYAMGAWALARRSHSLAVLLVAATFGPLALILGISLVTPLYHVRYMFTYSPAFYIVLAAGIAGVRSLRFAPSSLLEPIRRSLAPAFLLLWAAAAVLALRDFWVAPLFRPDDHRTAVRELAGAWRPGDVTVVNAGWAYTALATYWPGEVGGRYRITGALPEAGMDAELIMVTTGHVDGDAALGWGDPRSDFFAMPATQAVQQVADLFHRFPRVWHYRVYDTVNDPGGLVRQLLAQGGRLVADRMYGGEAFTRVEGYASPHIGWPEGQPTVQYGPLELTWQPVRGMVVAGNTVYAEAWWRANEPATTLLATSLRLIAANSETWAQPPDENPFSPMHTSVEWQVGEVMRQPLALAVPEGTPPGPYDLVLVPYETGTGQPLVATEATGVDRGTDQGAVLGRVTVDRPAAPPPAKRALATFGPLSLLSAESAATALSPGDKLSVDLLWQARTAPGEPYVVVIQLLDGEGAVAASAEMQPVLGSYPTSQWTAGELVRDRHYLSLPSGMCSGEYKLIVGVYRGANGERLTTTRGLWSKSDHWKIKDIAVR